MNGVTADRYARWLRDAPTHLLEAELVARRRLERAEPPRVVVGDLEVDAARSRVHWRGVEHVVHGRRLEVLFVLASEAAKGRKRVPSAVLANRVFRSMHPRDALANVRVYLSYLNAEFPGLVLMNGTKPGTGYGLRPDPPAQEEDR